MEFPEFRSRVAVITGASRLQGIGAAICRTLAAQGCAIFFTTFRQYDAEAFPDSAASREPEQLETELRNLGAAAAGFLDIDLAKPDSPTKILEAVEHLMGVPTILVNNAAHSRRDGFERLDASGLDAHYAVNLRATALLSVQFARRCPAGAAGRIINLTSGQERESMPGELAYAATKGAISAFTRSLAKEVAFKGITVNAVDPGPTDTGWMSDNLKSQLLAAHGYIGTPLDAAQLILFLASEAARQLNGEIIHARGI